MPCRDPVKRRAWGRAYARENADKIRASDRRYHRERRERAMDLLASGCVRCGETDKVVLTFDHINGDGARDRANGVKTREIVKAILEGNRTRFQVLCHNCNHRKRMELGEDRRRKG